MKHLLARLWADDAGAIITTEWVMVATMMVVGVTAGLVAVQRAVTSGLTGAADSIQSVNEIYRDEVREALGKQGHRRQRPQSPWAVPAGERLEVGDLAAVPD